MVAVPYTLRRTIERHPRAGKILLSCGVVSSVWYIAADVIGTLRYPGYSWLDQEFSELTAQGAPTRPLMIALVQFPYNLLVLALAAGLVTAAGPKNRAARIAAVGLLGYTTFGFVAGTITPMATREAMAAGQDTLRNAFHGPLTLVSDLFLVVAMGSAPTLLGKRFRYYSYATIAILIAAGAVTSRQIPQLSQGQSTPWMGVEERVNIYATMLWVAVTAIAVWRAKGSRAPGPLGKPTVTSQRMQRVSQ